eukprot:SAG22_NODE_220_length_14862_cov_73.769424_6_plen_449_part_01
MEATRQGQGQLEQQQCAAAALRTRFLSFWSATIEADVPVKVTRPFPSAGHPSSRSGFETKSTDLSSTGQLAAVRLSPGGRGQRNHPPSLLLVGAAPDMADGVSCGGTCSLRVPTTAVRTLEYVVCIPGPPPARARGAAEDRGVKPGKPGPKKRRERRVAGRRGSVCNVQESTYDLHSIAAAGDAEEGAARGVISNVAGGSTATAAQSPQKREPKARRAKRATGRRGSVCNENESTFDSNSRASKDGAEEGAARGFVVTAKAGAGAANGEAGSAATNVRSAPAVVAGQPPPPLPTPPPPVDTMGGAGSAVGGGDDEGDDVPIVSPPSAKARHARRRATAGGKGQQQAKGRRGSVANVEENTFDEGNRADSEDFEASVGVVGRGGGGGGAIEAEAEGEEVGPATCPLLAAAAGGGGRGGGGGGKAPTSFPFPPSPPFPARPLFPPPFSPLL